MNTRNRKQDMGEAPHSLVQKFFIIHLGLREKAWDIRVWPDQLIQVAEGRTRMTDLCVTSRDRPLEDIVTVPPLLCIEILKPEDRTSDTQEMVDEYLGMGVKVVWMIDPRRRKLYQTDIVSPHPVAQLTVPGTDILVYENEVFSELIEMEDHA